MRVKSLIVLALMLGVTGAMLLACARIEKEAEPLPGWTKFSQQTIRKYDWLSWITCEHEEYRYTPMGYHPEAEGCPWYTVDICVGIRGDENLESIAPGRTIVFTYGQ